MYEDLTKIYKVCDEELDLLQQKRLAVDKQDKIYIWKKIEKKIDESKSEK